MKRRLLLAVLLVLAVPAPAAASDPPAPTGDQEALEASAHRFCEASPGACKNAKPIEGFTESPLSFSRFKADNRWHVDWAATFATASQVLALRPDDLQLRVLRDALRYARPRVQADLVFLQLQRGDSCTAPGCGMGSPLFALTPAISALTHGAALRAFVRAYERTGDAFFAEVAGQLVEVFELGVLDGGLVTQGVAGDHFLMYSYDHNSYVFNGHAAGFASLAEAATSTPSLGDTATRAWTAANDAYGELTALFTMTAECRPLAYNVVREGDVLRRDKIEDQGHRNDVSIRMLRLAAARIGDGMLKGAVGLDEGTAKAAYLNGAAKVLSRTGDLPPDSNDDCTPGWAPGWATRIVSFRGLEHRPSRIGFATNGVRGFTRTLKWKRWGFRVATARGTARVCPNMSDCTNYAVRVRADRRTATVCDGAPVWLYERLRVRIRVPGRWFTIPAAAGGSCDG